MAPGRGYAPGMDPDHDIEHDTDDPEVPSDLLDLGVDLDLAGVDPAEFGALFGEG